MSDAESNLQAAERVVALLAENGVSAVVIGAVAMAAYRYVRHTEDIDLGVNADLSKMRFLANALKNEGFDVEFREPDGEDPLGGVIDISSDFGLVQVVNFADRFPAAIDDSLAGESLTVRPGSELRLAPLAQLIALKLYAGGLRSKADILELLRRNPDADIAAIRSTCQRYRLRGLNAILAELD
ncbi:MAG: nucleotidyl transferase AbiEii/AbiGii toxin family protein [Verrucomicrobiae bacterium]|nr:nucleotidyl transferase AbiEii/AbiGii toxin family protein [Verrucomicrobiae bacterium]